MKKILILFSFSLFLGNCSHLIDAIWNPDTPSYDVSLTGGAPSSKLVTISFTKSDHLDVRQSGMINSDKYFYGYYVYRSIDPYDGYKYIGVEAQSAVSGSDGYDTYHQNYVELYNNGASQRADSNGNSSGRTYQDTCPTSGVLYFYRVVSVYRDWDKNSNTWKTSTTDEDKSAKAQIVCP